MEIIKHMDIHMAWEAITTKDTYLLDIIIITTTIVIIYLLILSFPLSTLDRVNNNMVDKVMVVITIINSTIESP